MPLFRSQSDIRTITAYSKELIEKIIGEKVTYYAISKQTSAANLYGESIQKLYDPPVQVYGLIEWKEQEVTTTEFGQDITYSLTCYFLEDHLKRVNLHPVEGDIIDYNNVQFEITELQNPDLIWGKAYNSFNLVANCKSIRKNSFHASISASVDLHKRTRPDEYITSSFSSPDILFAYSGSTGPL